MLKEIEMKDSVETNFTFTDDENYMIFRTFGVHIKY